jgi:hypothetical protein
LAQGNPNPSPATRFQKGQSGNPKGITTAMKNSHYKAAESIATIREKALAIVASMDGQELLDALTAAVVALGKQADDRENGQPTQKQDITGQLFMISPDVGET